MSMVMRASIRLEFMDKDKDKDVGDDESVHRV